MTIYEYRCPNCKAEIPQVETNDRVRCQNCGHVFTTETPNMNETARIFWCNGCGCEVEGHEIALTGQHEACGEFVQVRTVFVPVQAFEMA